MANIIKKRDEVDDLNKWDLSKIYESLDDFKKDFEKVRNLTTKVLSYKGHILDSSETLYQFYQDSELLDRLLEKVYVYAHLECDTDTTNSGNQKIKMEVDKLNEEVSDTLSFISPEFLNSSYDKVLDFIKHDSRLEKYKFDLEKIYRYQNHVLSSEEEAIITKATNTFGTGDEVFYNLDNADINLGKIKDEDGEEVELTNSNYNKFMTSSNREVRKSAFTGLYTYFSGLKNTIAAALKGNIKENFFLSDVHKFENPLQMSLYADNIDIKVYKNLITTIHDHLDLMYRYMDIKRRALHLDKIHMYDIYTPIIKENNHDIPFEEGKKIVVEALKPLKEQYINDLNKAFDERWIDIYPNVGKKSGAYSWGCFDTNPYLLLNYDNTIDSVSTMAHELGHSMHSYYSKKQDYCDHQYPIFLAEIASTVNEMLLNSYLYNNATSKDEKIFYLTELLEHFRTTIYRQTMFAEFEMIMHDKYQNNVPLTEEEFSNTYYELNKLYYGDNVVCDDLIRYEWCRIPHFYTSFYVYKYATGMSSAIALSREILSGNESAIDAYLEFLSSGGNDYPLNILKKAGVDMTTPDAILKSLELFSEKLDELESLI